MYGKSTKELMQMEFKELVNFLCREGLKDFNKNNKTKPLKDISIKELTDFRFIDADLKEV